MGFLIFIGVFYFFYILYGYFQNKKKPHTNYYNPPNTHIPNYLRKKVVGSTYYWNFQPEDIDKIPNDNERLNIVNQILNDGKTARLKYKGSDGYFSSRDITPRKIVTWGGHYYLKAFCHYKNEDRTFKIDRIIAINGKTISAPKTERIVDFSGKKILMIENDLELARLCKEKLRKGKVSLRVVSDGISALKALEENHYDFIYINAEIPFVSGIEILRNIKNRILTQSPIVFFSNKEDNKLKNEVQRLGADGYYIQTSKSVDEIISAIEPFLGVS